jgi:hypothetical protein
MVSLYPRGSIVLSTILIFIVLGSIGYILLEAYARWNSELTNRLAETRCRIICLTKDNQQAPWVRFEAGALSKTREKTVVLDEEDRQGQIEY